MTKQEFKQIKGITETLEKLEKALAEEKKKDEEARLALFRALYLQIGENVSTHVKLSTVTRDLAVMSDAVYHIETRIKSLLQRKIADLTVPAYRTNIRKPGMYNDPNSSYNISDAVFVIKQVLAAMDTVYNSMPVDRQRTRLSDAESLIAVYNEELAKMKEKGFEKWMEEQYYV